MSSIPDIITVGRTGIECSDAMPTMEEIDEFLAKGRT